MRFAYSLAAYRWLDGGNDVRHAVGVCEATDADDALWLAGLIARDLYPGRLGFRGHGVMVCPADQLFSPRDCAVREPGTAE